MHPVETASPSGGSLRRCARSSRESRSTLTGTLPCSRPHPGSHHVTACHSMSQHHNCPGSKSTGRLAGSTWLWLKETLCFHPIHSHPGEEKKTAINPIQSSFWVKSPFSYIFLCFNRVNPGYNRVMYVQCMLFSNHCCHGGSTGIFHQRSQARINGPVRPSVWDFCRFCMTRPEPRPTTFISGQETLASLAYQGGSIWSMVGQQLETYCDLVINVNWV